MVATARNTHSGRFLLRMQVVPPGSTPSAISDFAARRTAAAYSP
jgi:hypothetical protein